jgi:hypothetical protein
MDYTEFNKRWPEVKERIKKEQPDIPDEDLVYEIGQEVALVKRLQKRTGKTENEIFEWLHIMG